MNNRSGLSLLELMLALGLLAVIAGGLMATVGLGLRLNDRTSALGDLHEPLAARRHLRVLLQSALPPDRVAPFEHGFQGDSRGFTFVTLAGRGLAPGAAALRVFVEVQNQTIVLRIETIEDTGPGQQVLTSPLTVSDGNVSLSYYDGQADPPSWSDTWTIAERLPQLVRIEVPEGSQPDWPEFSASLVLGP